MPGYTFDSTLLNICRDKISPFCDNINISKLQFVPSVNKGPYLFIVDAAENKFLIFDKQNAKLQLNNNVSSLIENTRIKSIQYLENTTYIINTYNGSYIFDPVNYKLQFIPESMDLVCSNIHYYQHSIWLSTTSNGIYSSKINGIKGLNLLTK